jgi:hypothetical protein
MRSDAHRVRGRAVEQRATHLQALRGQTMRCEDRARAMVEDRSPAFDRVRVFA